METRVAALYVCPTGPYVGMPGVDPWDETRDARLYPGPHPVVAHPPCGPWGRLSHFCRLQDKSLGPVAVAQVQKWGGVLEHPEHSRLWDFCGLPQPGELARPGEFTLSVEQWWWGHRAIKRTWLYVCGWPDGMTIPKGAVPTRERPAGAGTNDGINGMGHKERLLTTPAFAAWLVDLAAKCGRL